MTVTCVVQARMGSSRLPGKVLQPVGDEPMLAFQLRRLRDLAVDHLVVATSDLERDEPVADLARSIGVEVVRGAEGDVLGRFVTALDAFPADAVVRLTGDCPLTDPAIVRAVIDRHLETGADYTSNVFPRTFPKGLDVEVVRAGALRTAARDAALLLEREHVTPHLYRHPERFRLANHRAAQPLGDERWTVDTAEDLAVVNEMVREVGPAASFAEHLALAGVRAVRPVGEVWLRPADASDVDRVLAWRNEAASVRFSPGGEPVDADGHRSWFARRLDDPATKLCIAVVDDRPVGYTRVDARDATGEVSIALDPDVRGQGHGRGMLDALLRTLQPDLQVDRLNASVHTENGPSLRAFARAGFRTDSTEGDFVRLSIAIRDAT